MEGLAAPFTTTTLLLFVLWVLGFGSSGLDSDEIGSLAPPNFMGWIRLCIVVSAFF